MMAALLSLGGRGLEGCVLEGERQGRGKRRGWKGAADIFLGIIFEN